MKSNQPKSVTTHVDSIFSLSPLDGRYQAKTSILRSYFSEAALILARVKVEVEYLSTLSKFKVIRPLTPSEKKILLGLTSLTSTQLREVKKIEAQTHHDAKAVEYFLRQEIEKTSLKDISAFIHFGVTSEDINNLAYRLMTQGALKEVVVPALKNNLRAITVLAENYADLPMLARTHGQPAIPTTLGKELLMFALRLMSHIQRLEQVSLTGKFNGAVGGYHAQVFALPEIDWLDLSRQLVTGLGLEFNEVTTQIGFADDLVELFSIVHQTNSTLIDFNQDIWRYISDDWLAQTTSNKQVGSSTMPQKINPIDFENSEGNLVMANALLETFIRKLPISRLQRDLSESTVLRNIGSAFGHSLLAYLSVDQGLRKISANKKVIARDLEKNYNILAEAWQTWARATGDDRAYEKVSQLTKNKVITRGDWQKLTAEYDARLSALTPQTYLGLTVPLTKKYLEKINQYLKSSNSKREQHD